MSKEERAQARADKAARKAARPWPLRHWVLTGIGAIVVIGGIASAAGSGGSKGTSTPAASDQTVQSSAAPVDTPAEAATTPPPAVPQQLLDITGSGTKTTQKFTAAGDWDMAWSYDCSSFGYQGNFIVTPTGEDNNPSLANQSVNQLGKSGHDVEHYHHGGTYYLSINSECSWHVTVAG